MWQICAGWTLDWQGRTGNDNEGTTILEGIKAAVSADTRVEFQPGGYFRDFEDSAGKSLVADVGIVVLAEPPYAEGVGDRADLSLSLTESNLIAEMREQSKTVIVILLSGRPRLSSHLGMDWIMGSRRQKSWNALPRRSNYELRSLL